MATEKTDNVSEEPHETGGALADALRTASYVEELHRVEQRWIMNRLSWLFVSQSFLVLAFVTLVTSTTTISQLEQHLVGILRVFLPDRTDFLFDSRSCTYSGGKGGPSAFGSAGRIGEVNQ